MSRKSIVIQSKTDELLDKCIAEFILHHKEFEEIHISRNKIIYEIANFYLKN